MMDETQVDYIKTQIMQGETDQVKLSGIKLLYNFFNPGGIEIIAKQAVLLKALFRLLLVDNSDIRMEVVYFLHKLTALQNQQVIEHFKEEYPFIIKRLEINSFRENLQTFKLFQEFISLHYFIIHNLSLKQPIFQNETPLLIKRLEDKNEISFEPLLYAIATLGFHFEDCYKAAITHIQLPGKPQQLIIESLYHNLINNNSSIDVDTIFQLLQQNYLSNNVFLQNETSSVILTEILIFMSIDKSLVSEQFVAPNVIQSLLEILRHDKISQISRAMLQILQTISCTENGAKFILFNEIELFFKLLPGNVLECCNILINLKNLADWKIEQLQVEELISTFEKQRGSATVSSYNVVLKLINTLCEDKNLLGAFDSVIKSIQVQ